MLIINLLIAILFLICIASLVSMFILGIVLGPILKEHDHAAHQQLFTCFMPFSTVLLFDYVKSKLNLDKIPKEKQWVLIGLKYLIPTLFISFPMLCIVAYIGYA